MKNRLISKVLMGVGVVATLVVFYAIEPVFHPSAHAENGRIVTIYHDGQQQVIATDATTVGEALDRAGVKLEQNDAVEPAAGTKLVAQNYDVNVYRARPVIVVDGAQRYRIISPYQSAKKIAESAGLQIYDEDQLTISRIDDFVAQGGAGLMLTIKRSVPVHLMLYGKLVDVRTQAATIGDLMKEKGITLAAQDGVSPATATAVTPGMTVDVYRNGEQTVSEEQDVNFTIKQIQDADQPLGYKQVQTPGAKGKRIVTYQIELKNGREVGRKEIQSVVTVEPKEQVEVVGSKRLGSYTTPSQNETITWDYLIGKGLSREQAAGIMGNLMIEHGFQTSGDGLAQWTGSRKAQLMASPDPYNIYTQLDFMMRELQGPYSGVLNAIKASTGVESATTIFQNRYERCGVCREGSRIQSAYNILASH